MSDAEWNDPLRVKTLAERRAASRAGEARRMERLALEREELNHEIQDLKDRLVELGLSPRQADLLVDR